MKHKQYSATITIKSTKRIAALEKRINEAQECLSHDLNYQLFSDRYRRYRRGLGRCPRCGLKVAIKFWGPGNGEKDGR